MATRPKDAADQAAVEAEGDPAFVHVEGGNERAAMLAAMVAAQTTVDVAVTSSEVTPLPVADYTPNGTERDWTENGNGAPYLVRARFYRRNYKAPHPFLPGQTTILTNTAFRGDVVTLEQDDLAAEHVAQGYLSEHKP